MNLIVIFNVLYLIINIILIFYSITIIINYKSPDLDNASDIEKYLIADFQINETCPQGYFNIINGFYEGSHEGCYCKSNGSFYKELCTYEQLNKLNCSNAKKINKMMLENYEGKQFCTKKEIQYSYYLHNNYLSIGNCPNNYYNCGIIDSFNQSLCLPNANQCPINKIVINYQEKLSDKYKTYQLNNGKYIHISNNETNSKIIYDLTLTDIDYKCQYPDKNIIKYYYELENQLKCEMKDDSYKEPLDKINKKAFYEDNKIYDEIKKLPNYPLDKIEKDTVTLLMGEIKGYDLNIYSNITTLIKYNKIPSYFVLSFIIIWIFVFFIILGFIFLFCRRCINKEDYNDDYTVECESNNSEEGEKNCLWCLCLFILGALIIHCLIFRKGANKLKNSTILFLVLNLIIFLSSLIGYIILCYPLNSINKEIISTAFTIYEKDIIALKNMTYLYLILVLFCIFFLYIQRFRKSLDNKIPLNSSLDNLISPPPLQINNNNVSNPYIYPVNNNNINNYPMSNQYNINTNTNTGNMGYTSNTANI